MSVYAVALLLTGLCGRDDPIATARALMRQGLLIEAEQVLADVPSSSDAGMRAWVHLLRGNVAFERSDFKVAWDRYLEARRLMADANDRDGLRVAEGNLRLAEERLSRDAFLQRRRGRLTALLMAALLLSGAGILWLARVTLG